MLTSAESNLKTELKKVRENLDDETPEIIKATISRLLDSSMTPDILEAAHDTIKKEIKKLKNADRKELLRHTTLIPLQLQLGRIHPTDVDVGKKKQFLADLSDLKNNKSLQQKYKEETMLDSLGKGVKPGQIKHLAGKIRELAHLLISSRH